MKICLFSSYSTKKKIDNYIKFYLEMLKKHFDKIIFITNERAISDKDLSFLKEIGVSIKMVVNEGYDFGMWYKAISDINIKEYEQIAFVNDSCILFKDLDKIMSWVNKTDLDYFGITDSNQISYHLQSYFTVAKGRRAINAVNNYYQSNKIIISDDVRDIINTYEVGMCRFLVDNDLKVGAMFKYSDYPRSTNLSLMNVQDMIKRGSPLIKKKLLLNDFRDHERSYLKHHNFDFNFDYITQIKKIIYPYNISITYLLDL